MGTTYPRSGPSAQIERAYRLMADAGYRPFAPSDGLGDTLDIDQEIRNYTVAWWASEDCCDFFIGCCDFKTRTPTILVVEAARLLCGARPNHARALLRQALAELEKI
jgi:hypothetical protein